MSNQVQQKYGRNSDSRTSKKSKNSNDSGIISDLDGDFFPTKIIVFRNGDKFDTGTEVTVTRKEFKQWLTFLDGLTKKIRSIKAVNKLYNLDGEEIEEFKDLDQCNFYVASNDVFKPMDYGTSKPLKWTPNSKLAYRDPLGIDSVESLNIYMKKFGLDSDTVEANIESNLDFLKSSKKYGTIIVPQKLESSLNFSNNNGRKRNPELSVKNKTVSLPKIYVSNYQNKVANNEGDKRYLLSRYKFRRSLSTERIVHAKKQTPERKIRENEYEYEIDYQHEDEDFYYNQPNVSYYEIHRNSNDKSLKNSHKEIFYG